MFVAGWCPQGSPHTHHLNDLRIYAVRRCFGERSVLIAHRRDCGPKTQDNYHLARPRARLQSKFAPMFGNRRALFWVALCLVLLVVQGCISPVASGLNEDEANRVVVALDAETIDATKESDPSSEGKFRVLVPQGDTARALVTLRREQLPRQQPKGVLEAMGKGALVPSEVLEHAQLVAGLAGDLQKSLEAVDGILVARVHLNLPTRDPFREVPKAQSSASVLVEHKGATPPLTSDSIQRIVAGGVPGLLATDVAVVMIARASSANTGGGQFAHVGPIAVARSSQRWLQIALATLVLLVGGLAATTLFAWSKVARLRFDVIREKSDGHVAKEK